MTDGNLKSIKSIGSNEPYLNLGVNKNGPLNSKNLDSNSETFEGLQSVADQFEAIFCPVVASPSL